MNSEQPNNADLLDLFFKVTNLYESANLRQSILKQVIENSRDSSTELAKTLKQCFSAIKIDGFRTGKIPEKKIINEICRLEFWKRKKVLMRMIFDQWMEINFDRIKQVIEFSRVIDSDYYKKITDSLKAGNPSPDLGELADSFRGCKQCTTDEPIEMFFCAVILLKENQISQNGADIPLTEHQQYENGMLPEFWERMIENLNKLPADAEEWNSFEDFIQKANEMREEKDQEKISLFQPIVKAIEELIVECKEGLDYMENTELANRWNAFVCKPNSVDEVSEQIDLLRRDLKKLVEPLSAVYSNMNEEERALEDRKTLRLAVLRRFEDIDKRIGITGSEVKAPQTHDEDLSFGESEKTEPEEESGELPKAANKTQELLKKDKQIETSKAVEDEAGEEAEGETLTEKLDRDSPESDKAELRDKPDASPEESSGTQDEPAEDAVQIGSNKDLSASMTIREIASIIQPLEGTIRDRFLSQLLWTELKEDRFSSAYWIAQYFESLNETPVRFVPSWLVEFIALSRCLKHSFGPIAPRLSKLSENFSESIFTGDEEWKNGIRFLVVLDFRMG